MSDFSSSPLDLLQANRQKGYVGLHIEQGVPLLDRDLNLLQDLITATVRSVITRYIGNGISSGADGFSIQALAGPANVQNFNISAGSTPPGSCLVGGIEIFIPADIAYTAQAGVPHLTTPTAAQPNPRIDTVYLDVSLAEIDGVADPDLNNSLDVGIPTSVRLKPGWVARVAEGGGVPAAPAGHVFYPIASLQRPLGVNTIDASMITDLRQRRLTVSDMENRLHLAEHLVIFPSFQPSPNQFAPKTGPPGQPVNLNGRNFTVGNIKNLTITMGGLVAPISTTTPPTATLVVVAVPAGLAPGPVKISVTTDGGSVVSDDTFNILAPPPPPPAPAFAAVGSQFAPKNGPANQPVTLNGVNFDQPGLAVTLGGALCPLNGAATATTIPVKIPSVPAGARTFTVTTLGGSVTSTDVFTVS